MALHIRLGQDVITAASGDDAALLRGDITDHLCLEAKQILRRNDILLGVRLPDVRLQTVQGLKQEVPSGLLVCHTEILLTDRGLLRGELQNIIIIKMNAEILREALTYEASAGTILSADRNDELLLNHSCLLM